ncbi:hypothetical protein A4T07_002405 [Salmonella enterica subsp. enterica serovar Newmexico]|nr:hypothetical protein [Salmonella enterica]EDV6678557.1 hypothetical protein [Salmonella enterica subsp. enterica serovar Newmexico]
MLLKICREKLKPFAEYRITFYSREIADAGNFGGSVPEYKYHSQLLPQYSFSCHASDSCHASERHFMSLKGLRFTLKVVRGGQFPSGPEIFTPLYAGGGCRQRLFPPAC